MKNIIILLVAIFVTGVLSFNTKHYINLESGEQNYIRGFGSFAIPVLSEYNFKESGSWQNPLPKKTGDVLLTKCSIVGCKNFETNIKTTCSI